RRAGWARAGSNASGVPVIDGGAHSPTNLDVVADLGFDLVVVSSPMTGTPDALEPARAHPARRYHRALLHRERRVVEDSGTPVLFFEPDPEILHLLGDAPLDPSRNEEIIDATRSRVRDLLDSSFAPARRATEILAD
ncbi:MAG: hypothetical protein AAGK32_09670, partial [Actinomycetota bacterium]